MLQRYKYNFITLLSIEVSMLLKKGFQRFVNWILSFAMQEQQRESTQ